MVSFVLVPGAWHGAWCYARVASSLRDRGYQVCTPALSGVGERADLYTPAINVSTHIRDITSLLECEDLSDVVLVGHSYAGMVITGVADRMPERIGALVYIEAFLGKDGQSLHDVDLPEAVEADLENAKGGGGHTLSPPPARMLGVNAADIAWVDSKCTPQPLATFVEAVSLSGAYRAITRKTYIHACDGLAATRRIYQALRAEVGWRFHELPCGHDAMIDMPIETANILLDVAEDGAKCHGIQGF